MRRRVFAALFGVALVVAMGGSALAIDHQRSGFGPIHGHWTGQRLTGISGNVRSPSSLCIARRTVTIQKSPTRTGTFIPFGHGTTDRHGIFGINGRAPGTDVFQITVASIDHPTIDCGGKTIYVRFQSPV